DAAVPREMVWVQRRHRGDRRGDREVGRRVAGDLDHPVVVVTAALRVIGRGTEVAAAEGLAGERARAHLPPRRVALLAEAPDADPRTIAVSGAQVGPAELLALARHGSTKE